MDLTFPSKIKGKSRKSTEENLESLNDVLSHNDVDVISGDYAFHFYSMSHIFRQELL